MANINDLSRIISDQLSLYSGALQEDIDKAAEEVTKNAVNELREKSPKRPGGGRYARGWRVTKQNGRYVINNRIYQLTHLLEKGHATRNGGRTRPIRHIEPVESETIRAFERKVREAARG